MLALAYNKQAQLEMMSRTAGLGARIQTLNAWGYGLVARIRGTRPEVIEERAVRAIIEGLVPRPARRVNTDPYARYLEGLSLIRLGLRSPEQVEAEFGDVPGLADAFVPYRAALRARGVVDFDEQVYLALESLLGDGTLRRSLQAEHRHLLVDEFQDLTPAHVLLVRLLSCPAYNVFAVGDDNQTIYSHAGADPRFLVDFDGYFPAATHHALEVNYRCPRPVTEAAGHLLGYNTLRVGKVIRAGKAVATAATGLEVTGHPPDQGAAAVARLVAGWQEDGAVTEDMAALARVQSLLLGPHVALTDAGVPVDSIVDRTVLERLGVRAALAYLRIATDPARVDPADLVEVQRRPSGAPPVDRQVAEPVPLDRRRAPRRGTPRRCQGVAQAGKSRRRPGQAGGSGLGGRHHADIALGGARRRRTGLGDDAAGLHRGGGGVAPRRPRGPAPSGRPPPRPGAVRGVAGRGVHHRARAGGVTLSTVHRVKGREWPMVAVVGVNGGILPHRLAEGPAQFEEERRILHVAITRSSMQTVVLFDESRPSPFLGELDGTAPRRPAGAAGTVR